MALPLFGAQSPGTSGVGSSASATAPRGRAVGDLLTAHLYVYNRSVAVTATGWRLVPPASGSTSSSTFQILTYQRIADGTSADDFRATWTGSFYAHARVCSFTGALAVAPIHVAGAGNTNTSRSPVAPGATTTSVDCLIVALSSVDGTAARLSAAPAGFTRRDADDDGVYVATAPQVARGATGDQTWTLTASDIWVAYLFAITPAVQTVAVEIATEIDTATQATVLPGGLSVAVDVATEADTAPAVSASSAGIIVSLGVAAETDTAQPLTVQPGAITVRLDLATETDTAPAATAGATITVPLGIATETDTARPAAATAGPLTVALEVATETDTARTVTVDVEAIEAPSAIRATPVPERIAHQALSVRVRQVSRCLSTDPGAVAVLGKYFRGDWEINGELGWQTGSFDRCIGEEQEFTLTLPNGPGTDGRLHRDRLAIISGGRARPLPGGVVQYEGGSYRPGDEWFEVYDDDQGAEPVYVGTPTKAIVTRSSIQLSGWCGFWRLKKTREFQAGFWADAPRDVIEHYTGIWDCLYADDMRDVNALRVSQNATIANGVATLIPSGDGASRAAYLVGGSGTGYSFSSGDPVRAEAVINLAPSAVGTKSLYARFLITYTTSGDDLGTAMIDIGYVDGAIECKSDVGAGLVTRPGVKISLGVDVALAIEIRYGWSYFYVDGTLVAVLPWPESNAVFTSGRPKVVLANDSGAPSGQPMIVRSMVWRAMREFLLRGTERGDLRLPGAPTSGGLLGYYFDGAEEFAKFPPASLDSLGARLMLAPTKEPAAVRRDATLDFSSAGAPTWQPAGVSATSFAVRWMGSVYLDFAALSDVRLRVTADGRARVFVGKTVGAPMMVATAPGGGVAGVATSVVLSSHLGTTESGWYPLVVEFLEGGGVTKLLLEYEAATNPGVWRTVPATMLSPFGCFIGQVRNDSHYDTLKAIADSFGYQLTCKPYSLESGRFPGQLVPRVREGVDYDKALREDEATELNDAIDAEGVCDAIMADAAGVADPKGTAQLTGEMLNYDEITEHLGVLVEYEALAEITERELLEQRLASLLALSGAPWEEVSARPPGFHELLDRWPLPPTSSPGTPELFEWNPGDGIRLDLPSLGVVDRGPRQIMRVSRQMSREGLKPPSASFRQRPRSYKDMLRQLRRSALQPQRNYQGQLVERTGSLGSNNPGAAPDGSSRAALPADLASVVKAVFHLEVKTDATPWALQINGVTIFNVTAIGSYDVTSYVSRDVGTARMAAGLVAVGGSTGTWVGRLILTLRV